MRGLIKPYYKHGIHSVIREELILKAISDEMDSQSLENLAVVDSVYFSHMGDRDKSYKRVIDNLDRARKIKELDYPLTSRRGKDKQSSVENYDLVKVYHMLKKKGLLKELNDKISIDREKSLKRR